MNGPIKIVAFFDECGGSAIVSAPLEIIDYCEIDGSPELLCSLDTEKGFYQVEVESSWESDCEYGGNSYLIYEAVNFTKLSHSDALKALDTPHEQQEH